MYTLSIENLIKWALLKNTEGVSIGFIRGFSEHLKVPEDCYIDATARSLYAILDIYDYMFKWDEKDDNKVVFTNYYKNRLEEIEKSLLRSFPRKFVEIYNETDYSFINDLKESLK